jgi:tRNA threonylcarbamoyladenosine biosynthesis protein TsaB
MLVLALDTTAGPGSCAVTRGGDVLRQDAHHDPRSHAERLPRELMTLLDGLDLTLPEIDAFAVATGPGSFTGLRVGIATMQGLAFAAGKPLFGISGLDALARIGGRTARVATWVDAWRGEVYAGTYEKGRATAEPTVGRPQELLDGLRGTPTLFIGGGAESHRQQIREMLGPHALWASPLAPAIAGAIALLATEAAAAGHRPPPDAIRPLYVRRPDLERAPDARAVR